MNLQDYGKWTYVYQTPSPSLQPSFIKWGIPRPTPVVLGSHPGYCSTKEMINLYPTANMIIHQLHGNTQVYYELKAGAWRRSPNENI